MSSENQPNQTPPEYHDSQTQNPITALKLKLESQTLDMLDMSELTEICDKILQEQEFKAKTERLDLALCYFDDMKKRVKTFNSIEDTEEFHKASKMIQEVKGAVMQHKEQLMSYRAQFEQELSMVDLLLVVEVFNVYLHTQLYFKEGSVSDEDIRNVQDILAKIDEVAMCEQFIVDNIKLAECGIQRSDGFFTSMAEFLKISLKSSFLITDEQLPLYKETLSSAESIFLKLSAAPVNCYDAL